MDPEIWGTLPTLFTGLAFTLGLVLVLIAGSSLLTGNMLLVPLSAMDRGSPCRRSPATSAWSCSATSWERCSWPSSCHRDRRHRQRRRRAGSTAALTYERLAGIAEKKALDESSYQVFLRALGANWLVCLAVWMAIAADSVGSKILAMLFP
jgi:formate/nitrite transporter FocA (FNT family)